MLPHPAHAKWIRKGKKFPDDTLNLPTDLHDLYDSVLGVPTTIRTFLLPSVDISVTTLLRFPLPRVFQGSITASDPASFFGDAIPDDNLAHMKIQNIPPKEFVKDVRKAVGQALLDGKHSVCHPIERHAPLPLWMITFWEELHVALEIKASWEHAYNWVQRNIGTNPLFGQVDKQLAILPWNKPLVGPAASGTHTTIVLARFLSDESWMPGVLMDMMTACLSDPKCGTIIADTGFMNAIVTAQSISYFDKEHRGLKEINERLRVLSILYAPVYLPDPGHWIALSINLMTRSFCYGDSLGPCPNSQRLQNVIEKLQWWLEKCFGGKFRDDGPTLAHGRQKDLSSCGFFAINAIEHAVFGKQLLDANTVTSQRLEWFILTARAQVSEHQIVHNLPHQSQPILPSPSIAPPPEPFTPRNTQTNGAPTQSEAPEVRVWKAEKLKIYREKAYLVKFKREEADRGKLQAQRASKEREREEVRDREGMERERVQLEGCAERGMREQGWEEVNISSVHTHDSLTARAMKAIDLHSPPAVDMCWNKVNPPPTIVSADAPVIDMCWGTVTRGESIDGPLAEVSPPIDMCWGTATGGELVEVSPAIDMCWGTATGEELAEVSPAIDMCWGTATGGELAEVSPAIDMCWGTATRGESIDGPLAEVPPPIDMCWGAATREESIDGPLAEVSPPIDMCWGAATRGESIDGPLAEVSPPIDMCWGSQQVTAIPGESAEVSPPIEMRWGGQQSVPTDAKQVSPAIDMCWGSGHGAAIDGNEVSLIDMQWGSTDSTKTSTINMHWGEDQPERGATVPANAPFIGEDLNEDINMHCVDSSDWQEIIPTDYTEIEHVGVDGGQLKTESLPSAEQSDSQDQVAVLFARARCTLDMAVDLLTTMPETTVSTIVRRERARLLDVLSTFDRYMD